MGAPHSEGFNRSYLNKQIARTLKTLEQINKRGPVTPGLVIPTVDDIPINDGRRLEATVMFLDISKFSARPAWTEEEQQALLRILSLFFTEMIRIIEDYGGEVEKNTGDGLMAYFVRHPEDTVSVQQRAVAAALTMFYAADNLINPKLKASGIPRLDFRICLDHGPVTVAKVGTARGFNGIVAIGTTANIASKMLSFAEPNSILIGTDVKEGLPVDWQVRWVTLKTVETGWVYRSTGFSYAFWSYIGRWKEPIL